MTRAAVTGVWFLVFIAPVGLYGPQPLDCITAHTLPRLCALVVYITRVAKSLRGISVRVDSTHFVSYMDDGSRAHAATHSYYRNTHAPTSPRTHPHKSRSQLCKRAIFAGAGWAIGELSFFATRAPSSKIPRYLMSVLPVVFAACSAVVFIKITSPQTIWLGTNDVRVCPVCVDWG
jgi:hypothetical protein